MDYDSLHIFSDYTDYIRSKTLGGTDPPMAVNKTSNGTTALTTTDPHMPQKAPVETSPEDKTLLVVGLVGKNTLCRYVSFVIDLSVLSPYTINISNKLHST